MKTPYFIRLFYSISIFALIFISCSKDDGPSAIIVPATSNGLLSNNNIKASGTITQTENGYIVDGTVTIATEASGDVVFEDANLELEFNSTGTLTSVTGTSTAPSMDNYFEFENPFQADVGYFLGSFLNENRNYEVKFEDFKYYFVFALGVDVQLKLGANDDSEAQKPLTIKSPIGGHIAYIADFTDPLFFFSIGASGLGGNNNNGGTGGSGGNSGGSGSNTNNTSSKLGAVSFGASYNSNYQFVPTNPIDGNFISFPSSFVMGGTVSFYKVLEASGMYYQNLGFDVNANFEEPMQSTIGAGYRGGINGALDLSLDIKSFISFGFPIASGSASIVTEASTNNGFIGKAFINGLVEPDLSWWPSIIPVSPNGNLNAYGFVEETGNFDIGLSGNLGLETPTGTQSVGGAMRATPEAFTMTGQVTVDDDSWEAIATFTKDETRVVATPPVNFTTGISETVSAQIDAAIATTEQAIADVEAANEQYEFELSLRGLRTGIPIIIDRAQQEINTAVNNAIASANADANRIVEDNGAALCSTNISSKVNAVVQPYRDVLNRLKNAVNDMNDNDQTRAELESALRQLASMDKMNETVTVTITYGNKANFLTGKCTIWSSSTNRSYSISRTIINTEQKNHLLEAADNVKYITEAEGIKFDAQIILDNLPTVEDLEKLKVGVQDCVNELTDGLTSSGYRYNHDTKVFSAFIIVNGEEKAVNEYDIFSSTEMVERATVNTTSCNPEGALRKLLADSQKN